jgi:Tol biopolymer transport system component
MRFIVWIMISILVSMNLGTVKADVGNEYRIAYRSAADSEIWTIKPDGSDARQITYDHAPKLGLVASPDGQYLAYYVQSWYDGANTNNLTYQVVVVLDVTTGEQRMITGQEAIDGVSWSPDSQQLAFIVLNRQPDLSTTYEVDVINHDGSGRTKITQGDGYSSGVDWSPDGKFLLLAAWRQDTSYTVLRVNADGSDVLELTRFDSCFICFPPQWTPDGQAVVFYRHPELFIVDADGQNRRQLTDFIDVYNVVDVAYARYDGPQYDLSADSQQLVYVMGYPIELVKLSLAEDGWKKRQVIHVSPLNDLHGVLLSPDGQTLFSQISTETGAVLVRVDLESGALTPLVKDGLEPVILKSSG